MLQASFVELIHVVQRTVVVRDPPGRGNLKSGQTGVEEDTQVRVAAGTLEGGDGVGGRHGIRRGLGELIDQPAALIVCGQHDGGTGIAPRVEVQHNADALCPWMLIEECARSDQTALFTVGEQEDHIVA
jgi:hypothetical protein